SLFESLGFTNVETFIASGNVIFESKSRNIKALEKKIEEHLRKTLGYDVTTFIRTDKEVKEIAEYQPFSEADLKTAVALNIGFLADQLGEGGKQALLGLKTETDDFHVNGREIYWLSRQKQSESAFSNAVFERIVKTRVTFRGTNTVLRIAAKNSVNNKAV